MQPGCPSDSRSETQIESIAGEEEEAAGQPRETRWTRGSAVTEHAGEMKPTGCGDMVRRTAS